MELERVQMASWRDRTSKRHRETPTAGARFENDLHH